MLPAPGFHHLHLNSLDPAAAIGFYVRQFASTSKTSWGGFPALASPNDVLLLFGKVDAPPPVTPQSAIWHFGWHVTDVRKSLATYKSRPEVKLLPLYTTDEGGSVLISSDTWPPTGAVLGLTKARDRRGAKPRASSPTGGGGFAYMAGPDGAIVEYLGDLPAERMNHVHLWQEQPFCAQLWYQKHLNAAPVAGRGPATPRTEAELRGRARTRPHLAGAHARGHVPHAVRRRHLRRRHADVVHAPGRRAARAHARAVARTTSRSASPISTPGSPSCAARASRSCRSPTRSATPAPS